MTNTSRGAFRDSSFKPVFCMPDISESFEESSRALSVSVENVMPPEIAHVIPSENLRC